MYGTKVAISQRKSHLLANLNPPSADNLSLYSRLRRETCLRAYSIHSKVLATTSQSTYCSYSAFAYAHRSKCSILRADRIRLDDIYKPRFPHSQSRSSNADNDDIDARRNILQWSFLPRLRLRKVTFVACTLSIYSTRPSYYNLRTHCFFGCG